jgi:3-oxoadipate enol-lactonase
VASVALHHQAAGPDRAHVALMGGSLGATLELWDAQEGPLAERLRVVRFDHRGHGGSPVPPGPYSIAGLGGDVLALMDTLGAERASYCGLSMGGMVGMWLAAHAPERLERLVLICTAAHLPPPEAWAERAAAVLAAGTVEVVADGVLARWLTPEFAREHPEVVAWLRSMLVATPPEGYAGCCRAIERMDLRGDLPRIQAPTLVVAAAQDTSTPPEHGEAIAAAIPGARFELVSPSAHIAAVERADEVTALIRDHLAPVA